MGKVFVQAIKDRYKESSDSALHQSEKHQSGTNGGKPFIRRPTNGIQIKEDTFATIRVVAAEAGGNRLLIDAGSRRTYSKDSADGKKKAGDFMTVGSMRATDIYSNFLLQQVQEERQEKQQILETFGEAYIFLFGQRARVISFSGVLANTFDFNWEAEWWENYEKYLRGTRCVENDARVYISYDNTLVGGYIISTSSAKDTMNKNHVSFSFQLFVTYYSNFSSVGDASAYQGYGWHALTAEGNLDVSAAELTAARPVLLPDKIPINVNPLITGNKLSSFTTFENAVTANLKKVTDAWGQTSQVVNSALDKAAGFMNPDGGVRIPVGFEGSLVFRDEPQLVTQHEAQGGTVRYTTFADNDAEFVGVSDHYGGTALSMNPWGAIDEYDPLKYSQDMVDEARKEWRKNGFKVPDTELGPLSKFLVSKGLGLSAVGSTKAWQAASTALKAGSANPPGFATHGAAAVETHEAVAVGSQEALASVKSLPVE
jgi:hypothetical protein